MTASTVRTAIGYIRVSTEEQASLGQSLDAQDERLHDYCTRSGLSLVELVREEGISGSIPLYKRPEGCRLEKLMKRHKATHLVAIKLDRLFRNAIDALTMTKEWDDKNITLHLVDFGGMALDTSSAMGRMMLTMMAGIAEMERNIIAERTTAAMAHMKKHRKVYTNTVFGFDLDGEVFVENPHELAIRDQIVSWRFDDRLTLTEIACRLNGAQIPGKLGGQWHARTIKNVIDNTIYQTVGWV